MVTDAERTSLPLLGALATAAGASWTFARFRADKERKAFARPAARCPADPTPPDFRVREPFARDAIERSRRRPARPQPPADFGSANTLVVSSGNPSASATLVM